MPGKPFTRNVAALCLMLGIAAGGAAAFAQEAGKPLGTVVQMSGEWVLEGTPRRPISLGEELPAGGKIRLTSARQQATTSFIEIVLRNGMRMKISCDKERNCGSPIPLPAIRRREPSLLEKFWQLLGIRAHDEDVPTFSRGGQMEDGVVRLNAGRPDLRGVFRKMIPGLYLLRFQSVGSDGQRRGGKASGPFVYDWEPDKPTPLTAGRLHPGLYQLDLLETSTARHEPTGSNAWLLLAAPRDYQRLKKLFHQGGALTQRWEKDLQSPAARIFLRAYLNYLAAEKLR